MERGKKMDIEGINFTQILTVGIFLLGLVALQVFVTKNKGKLSGTWGSNKRIQLIEEKALSSTEKLRIISVDSIQFLLISNKGKKSSLITLGQTQKNPSTSSKRNLVKAGPQQKSTTRSNSNIKATSVETNLPGKNIDHPLSKAIQTARQMNPAVSYRE